MNFRTRKLIKWSDLNPRSTLFGGQILLWIDEEASIYTICQLGTDSVVTKCMSEINFMSPVKVGDIIEIGIDLVRFGTTSIELTAEVRNKNTKQAVVKIDKIVFVAVDAFGKPRPHGKTNKIELDENL